MRACQVHHPALATRTAIRLSSQEEDAAWDANLKCLPAAHPRAGDLPAAAALRPSELGVNFKHRSGALFRTSCSRSVAGTPTGFDDVCRRISKKRRRRNDPPPLGRCLSRRYNFAPWAKVNALGKGSLKHCDLLSHHSTSCLPTARRSIKPSSPRRWIVLWRQANLRQFSSLFSAPDRSVCALIQSEHPTS